MKSKAVRTTLTYILLLIIVAVGIIIRFQFLHTIEYKLVTDALNYHNMVVQFFEKGFLGYLSDSPNAYITPGYPLFMAAVYSIAGIENGVYWVQAVQAVLGGLTAAVLYMICQRLFKNKLISLIGAALMSFYPVFIMASMLLLTECTYNFFFVVYLLVQIISIQHKTDKLDLTAVLSSVFAGILLAVCTMIRPAIFPLLVVPYAYKAIVFRKKTILFEFLLFVGGILLIMSPWWVRNVVVLDEFIPLATQTGNPMLAGTFPYYIDYEGYQRVHEDEFQEAIMRIQNGFTNETWHYLGWYTFGKFDLMFFNIWFMFEPVEELSYLNNMLRSMHFFIVIMGCTGMLFGLVNKKMVGLSIFTLLTIGSQFLFIPTERYAYTVLPLLTIFSVWMLYIAGKSVRRFGIE